MAEPDKMLNIDDQEFDARLLKACETLKDVMNDIDDIGHQLHSARQLGELLQNKIDRLKPVYDTLILLRHRWRTKAMVLDIVHGYLRWLKVEARSFAHKVLELTSYAMKSEEVSHLRGIAHTFYTNFGYVWQDINWKKIVKDAEKQTQASYGPDEGKV